MRERRERRERADHAPTIGIVTPAPRGSRAGNRLTALRWALLLRRLGCRVFVERDWTGRDCDLLVAVHAVKTAPSVLAFARDCPGFPLAVLLAGTDVYPERALDETTAAALRAATVILALQPLAARALPVELRAKVRTIVQSATAVARPRAAGVVQACVVAHLRSVKDPLLPVRALRLVPQSAQVRVVLAGAPLETELAADAMEAMRAEPRFFWLGEVSHRAALELLGESHCCVIPSASEGGANVLSEAVAAATPPLASDIPGNVGVLGPDWPGLFPPGDAVALAGLLTRAAIDGRFAAELRAATEALQPLVRPERELERWHELLLELRVMIPPVR